ncbi:MAG: ribosome maturation factor RimM [Chitinophagaceae bacterium]
MTKYNSIGKIAATFGLVGEVILVHNLGKKTSLKGLTTIFLEERKNEMIPYFIESSKIKNANEVYLRLEGIQNKEDAKKITQKEVWLTEEAFTRYAAKSSSISLLGYHLVEAGNDIGEILEIIEQPHQLLCRIDLAGKEALVPLHEQTLDRIDRKNKQVHVILPEGLLDVFR